MPITKDTKLIAEAYKMVKEDNDEVTDDDFSSVVNYAEKMLIPMVYVCGSDFCRGYGGSDWDKISLSRAMDAYLESAEHNAEFTENMPQTVEEFADRILRGEIVHISGEEDDTMYGLNKEKMVEELIEMVDMDPKDYKNAKNFSVQHGIDPEDFQTEEDVKNFLGITELESL